jgi:uncharacterized membrane protein
MLWIWNNWLILAMAAPFLWALMNIIDVYFVSSVYENEWDGAIISSLFQIVPWFLVPILGIGTLTGNGVILATLSGVLTAGSIFFYFRAMFARADAALILIIWNTGAILVPLLQVLVGERLPFIKYAGIIIIFLGATLISADSKLREKKFGKMVLELSAAVVLYAIATVLQGKAYAAMPFWSGLLFVSLGSAIVGIVFWVIRPRKNGQLKKLVRKYSGVFILAEGLALVGNVIGQRALATGSVSLVAALGNIQPAWIMFQSLIIYFLAKLLGFGGKESVQHMYREQLVGWKTKLLAVVIMAAGVYIIG